MYCPGLRPGKLDYEGPYGRIVIPKINEKPYSYITKFTMRNIKQIVTPQIPLNTTMVAKTITTIGFNVKF